MKYEECQEALNQGLAISRLAWRNPDHHFKLATIDGKRVAQASHREMRLTYADLEANDWIIRVN
jgi:hypothetical protein